MKKYKGFKIHLSFNERDQKFHVRASGLMAEKGISLEVSVHLSSESEPHVEKAIHDIIDRGELWREDLLVPDGYNVTLHGEKMTDGKYVRLHHVER